MHFFRRDHGLCGCSRWRFMRICLDDQAHGASRTREEGDAALEAEMKTPLPRFYTLADVALLRPLAPASLAHASAIAAAGFQLVRQKD